MKNILTIISLLLIFSFFGCRQSTDSAELEMLQSKFEAVTAELETLQSKLAPEKQLVHIVWFKMKPEADPAGLISEIKKLDAIEVLNDLEVGKFQDLGDPRAMSELDIVMQMGFDSEEDYKTYQEHPIHLSLKKAAGDYLNAPPLTYDFWTE